jgi:hypothetical protein
MVLTAGFRRKAARAAGTTAFVMCLTVNLAYGQTPPIPSSQPITSPPGSAAPVDPQKQLLEIEKLKAEIAKLRSDTRAPWESWATILAPAASLISVVVLVGSIMYQRRTTLEG